MTEHEKKMKLGAMTRKNLLWILLIMLFLTVMYVAIIPVSADGTVVSAPVILDTTKTPSSSLSVDVSIEKVENLFVFEFTLYYNATVLTATSVSSYDPFTNTVVSRINNTGGSIYVCYSMPMGTVVGFSTVDPAPIVKIDFTVNVWGKSLLDLKNVELVEPVPIAIPCNVVDGFFCNALGYIDDLLDDYINLLADYNDLLDDYNSLSTDYDVLLDSHDTLTTNYSALSDDFNNLTTLHNSLLTNYTNLQGDYNSLSSNYDTLEADYNLLNSTYSDLKSKHDTLTSDLGTTRNLSYVFIITTLIFIATTAYLAIRKPKVKPELETT